MPPRGAYPSDLAFLRRPWLLQPLLGDPRMLRPPGEATRTDLIRVGQSDMVIFVMGGFDSATST